MSSNNQIVILKKKGLFEVHENLCVDNDFVPTRKTRLIIKNTLKKAYLYAQDYEKENVIEYGIYVNPECLEKGKKTAIIPDNQHPADAYVRLNDVLGLFKNRRLTKTRVRQREHIIQHLNKLKRYGNEQQTN